MHPPYTDVQLLCCVVPWMCRALKKMLFWPVQDPSPINRVVRHFQLLFGVTTIEGCLPKLNEVYRFSSETQTFLRTCGDMLNMSSNSNTAIMRRLETLLEGKTSVNAQNCLLRVSHDAESWPKA